MANSGNQPAPISAPIADNVLFQNLQPSDIDSQQEILTGLQKKQKRINPKFFYDTKGSKLFEQITELAEYYPTRTERNILTKNAGEIASYCGLNTIMIEPGSGSSEKVRLLLDELKPSTYVPMDIAADFLYHSAIKLGADFPWLNIHAICADFSNQIQFPLELPAGKRVVFYPGSTIGNMEPGDALQFLRGLHSWLKPGDGVLIGIDLHKSAEVLHAAYNDSQGITAEFNLNALNNINNMLQANFNLENFSHHAFYDSELRRIEMHLRSNKEHTVSINDITIEFTVGESIHTENSYKYTLQEFSRLANEANFINRANWVDDQQLFSVHYLELQY